MTLTVDIRHRLGAFSVEAAFEAEKGVTALFGRSGSGKTSLINIIAGLVRPEKGRIAFGTDVLADSDSRRFVPPYRRRFGYVFQEARLFPHISVRRNLTYGRWFAPKNEAGSDFDRIIDLLGIEKLLSRAPAHLSGGEKQRVAIGRALLSKPRMLLMDEPLAALDEQRKTEILPYLERVRDESAVPIVYVSHSVAEVARLANQVIVLEHGRITSSGSAAAVLSQPSGALDQREAGVLVEGVVGGADDGGRVTRIGIGAIDIRIPRIEVPVGKPIRLRIAARDVMLATTRPESVSALNVLSGTIVAIDDAAQAMCDVRIDCGGMTVVSRITALSRDLLSLEPGKPVYAMIKSAALEP